MPETHSPASRRRSCGIVRKHVVSALLAGVALGCDRSSGPLEPTEPSARVTTPRAAAGLLPELQTVVPQDVRLVRSGGREIIRFTNAIANTGRGPLHVIPRFPEPGSGGTQDAIQQIFDANGNVLQEQVVSQYEYHPGHKHWHIAGVAVYTIKSGSLSGPILGDTRQKTTFCLIDVARLAGFPNQAPRTYSECNSGAQGISVGWADEYSWWLDDQDLDITGAPAGKYYLISKVNAARRFIEETYTNNRVWVAFQLRRDASGRATIRLLNHSPCTGALCSSLTGSHVVERFARPAP